MLLKTVDIYRFDDGWRWVRIVGGEEVFVPAVAAVSATDVATIHVAITVGVDGDLTDWLPRHHHVPIFLDFLDEVYLVLQDPSGNSKVLFRAEVGGNIFGMELFSSGYTNARQVGGLWEVDDDSPLPVKEGLVARAWPLAIELYADVDQVQFGIAENAIKLPNVLPDRVWNRMAEREAQISTSEDALEALRYAFADLKGSVRPRDHSFDRALIADIFISPPPESLCDQSALGFAVIFSPQGNRRARSTGRWSELRPSPRRAYPREWMVTYEGGVGSKGETFLKALDGAIPNYGGRLMKKSEFDALWDAIVVPGEAMFDPEPYFLLDAPHPAFLPLDTFLALAREEGLL